MWLHKKNCYWHTGDPVTLDPVCKIQYVKLHTGFSYFYSTTAATAAPPPGGMAVAHRTTGATAAPPPTNLMVSTTAAARAPPPPSGSSTEVHDASTAVSFHGPSAKVGTTTLTNVAEIPADDSSEKPPGESTCTTTYNPNVDDTGKGD